MDEKNIQEDLKSIVKGAIEPKLQDQFNLGIVAGFKAGCAACYEEVKGMTSAKKIIKHLREKAQKEYSKVGLKI